MDSINFFIVAFVISNVVLTQFLGMCSFFGVSNERNSALGMGLSVLFVITLSAIVCYGLYHGILVPYKLTHLRTLVFILVISGLVQIVELFIKKVSPALYKVLGIYLPLITTNCVVLGVVLLNITYKYTFLEMVLYSIGTSLGYSVVIYLFSFIREQIAKNPIPAKLKGVPIALFTAGIMSIVMATFK
jgi:Na+-translocating ferredoxin:NAD+ oxidoreductase subunit A